MNHIKETALKNTVVRQRYEHLSAPRFGHFMFQCLTLKLVFSKSLKMLMYPFSLEAAQICIKEKNALLLPWSNGSHYSHHQKRPNTGQQIHFMHKQASFFGPGLEILHKGFLPAAVFQVKQHVVENSNAILHCCACCRYL